MFGTMNKNMLRAPLGAVAMAGPQKLAKFGLFGVPAAMMAQGGGQPQMAEAGQMAQGGQIAAPVNRTPAPPLEAQQGAPGHWSVGGFDQMRSQPTMPRPLGADGLPTGPLGGSMRQPFDYSGALEKLRGPQKKFGPWKMAAAALADHFSGRSMMLPYMMHQKDAQERRNQDAQGALIGWRYKDYQRQNEADLRASNPFTIGRSRVGYDPATGQVQELYRGPQDFELYAQELGLQPGTDEYFQAVEDYVLRSSGPSAHDRDLQLDDFRTGNDAELERLRYGNRVGMERLRQGNRRGMVDYRNANPPPSRSRASGKKVESDLPVVKTPAEARALPSGTRFRTPEGKVKVVP